MNILIPRPAAKFRLFCFPYAGGGAYEYRSWAQALSEEIELCAIQLQGRESRLRETPFTQIRKLVETIGDEITPFFDKPFFFFGHSFGAITSFEVTRFLRDNNLPLPEHLFVSGSRAPQVPNPEPPVYHLPDSEMIDAVCSRYDGIPKEVLAHEEMMALLLPAMRADFTMSDTYSYSNAPPFDFAITCLGSEDDPCTSIDSLNAWRKQTTGDFVLKVFSGGHFFIREYGQAILEILYKAFQASNGIFSHNNKF